MDHITFVTLAARLSMWPGVEFTERWCMSKWLSCTPVWAPGICLWSHIAVWQAKVGGPYVHHKLLHQLFLSQQDPVLQGVANMEDAVNKSQLVSLSCHPANVFLDTKVDYITMDFHYQ